MRTPNDSRLRNKRITPQDRLSVSDDEVDVFEFPFMPEDKLINKIREYGHQVWDLRKDPSPVKYIVQINSKAENVDEVDLLAVASLGIIAFYYSPTRSFVIEKTDWRPCNITERKNCTYNWRE